MPLFAEVLRHLGANNSPVQCMHTFWGKDYTTLRLLPQVLERRKDVMFKVNTKAAGDVFGEISLMYDCPRSATVAATTNAVVWVLERDVFRCAGCTPCRACLGGRHAGTQRRPSKKYGMAPLRSMGWRLCQRGGSVVLYLPCTRAPARLRVGFLHTRPLPHPLPPLT